MASAALTTATAGGLWSSVTAVTTASEVPGKVSRLSGTGAAGATRA